MEKKSEALSYLYHALLLNEIGVPEEMLNWWIYKGFQSYTIKEAFFKVALIDEAALKADGVRPEQLQATLEKLRAPLLPTPEA